MHRIDECRTLMRQTEEAMSGAIDQLDELDCPRRRAVLEAQELLEKAGCRMLRALGSYPPPEGSEFCGAVPQILNERGAS